MSDFALQRRNRRQQSGRKSTFFIILLVFLLWLSYKGVSSFFEASKSEMKMLEEKTRNEMLQGVVDKALAGSSGSFAVYIKNLKTGESYAFNEHRIYETASLYKLWVMGATFKQLESGQLHEDDVLKEDVSVLNDKFSIASESAELTDGEIELSVQDALEKMITVSDNYAALLLAWKLRLSTIAAYLKNNGFSESKVGVNGDSPTATASDIGLFFEKLYKGELGNTNSTQAMIALLKRQRLNGKIPKYLPETAPIAHKTGELDEFSHDGGIVFTQKGDYIIVVLSETKAPATAVDRIGKISSAVYSYFTQ